MVKKVSPSSTQKIGSLLRNPMVQRALAWLLPIVISWVMSKLNRRSTKR